MEKRPKWNDILQDRKEGARKPGELAKAIHNFITQYFSSGKLSCQDK